jgi:hypothetical protein
MQLTLDIPNKTLFNNILWFLNRFKEDGVKITTEHKETITSPKSPSESKKGLDFSAFDIKSFNAVDGLAFQKKIRNEW